MRRTGLLWAAAIIVVANAAAWGAAAMNRRGEPEAILELTERELRLPAKQAENTALTLSLVFEPPGTRGTRNVGEAGWFDRAKLQSIGFDCRRPVTPEQRGVLPDAHSAVDVRGARVARRVGARLAPGSDRCRQRSSGLRARHPDRRRVAVVEATAALRYIANPGQPPFLMGRVTSVLPPEINVPREWRGALEGLQSDAQPGASPPNQHEPGFRVTVSWGVRLEPWITNVELLTPKTAR